MEYGALLRPTEYMPLDEWAGLAQKADQRLPDTIITTMDRRASAHAMRHWQQNSDLQSANEINVAWWERRETALEEPAVIALRKELEECCAEVDHAPVSGARFLLRIFSMLLSN